MMAILSIDDDVDLQELVEVGLKRYGYEVRRAMTGETGLELARELKPDLILLDMMLPTLNGVEVLKILKADDGLKRIPVIVVTAFYGQPPFTKETLEAAGAVSVLQKPVRFEDLNALIVRILTDQRPGPH
jgi:DNA-binding response OmpR family regulator